MTEPANDSAPKPPVFGWLRRLRFSLRSLVLLVLLLASLPVLWMRWDAWEKMKVLGHHERENESLRSPDGLTMVGSFDSSKRSRGVNLFGAESGVPRVSLEGTDRFWNFTFTPDSKWILGVGDDPVIGIWSVSTGEKAGELLGVPATLQGMKVGAGGVPAGPFLRITVSPDLKWVAAMVPGEGVYVWSFAERELKLKIPAPVPENGMGAPAFSSDGTRLIVPGPETSATIWETETGRALGEVSGHRNQIEIAKFSPDDSKILTYSVARGEVGTSGLVVGPSYWNYSEIRIWDAKTFKPLSVMFGHHGYDVDFSADGEDLVIKEYGGEIVQWHARRPGWWWGVAWLPEFWLTALFALACVWSLRRDWKQLRHAKPKPSVPGA